ncbi:MAG TPA: hypothetical protein GX515_08890 [Firmicutes bacterium]|nr:hypothetical protein [Bacillota bacterium]
MPRNNGWSSIAVTEAEGRDGFDRKAEEFGRKACERKDVACVLSNALYPGLSAEMREATDRSEKVKAAANCREECEADCKGAARANSFRRYLMCHPASHLMGYLTKESNNPSRNKRNEKT